MTRRKPLTDEDGEVRSISAKDLPQAKPFSELPGELQGKLKTRGPQKEPTKEQISIRLSREVVDGFRAFGEGWQTKIDLALKEWLTGHKPA